MPGHTDWLESIPLPREPFHDHIRGAAVPQTVIGIERLQDRCSTTAVHRIETHPCLRADANRRENVSSEPIACRARSQWAISPASAIDRSIVNCVTLSRVGVWTRSYSVPLRGSRVGDLRTHTLARYPAGSSELSSKAVYRYGGVRDHSLTCPTAEFVGGQSRDNSNLLQLDFANVVLC